MLSFRMPFPRVPCEIYVPTYTQDDFGNDVPDWDVTPIETECSFATGRYRSETRDDFSPADPHGDDSIVTFFLPKTMAGRLRGAIIRVTVDGEELDFHVVGDPLSYMRDATPGDMSWAVEGVLRSG